MSAMDGYLTKRAMREEWETPDGIFAPLHAEFVFRLDAAANAFNAKCPNFLSPKSDGLAVSWVAHSAPYPPTIWLNPPYGYRNLALWMRKAYEESLDGATVVCLVPAHTGQPWWHDWVIGKASEIRWIKGKVKFVGAASCAPFPSCLVIYRPAPVFACAHEIAKRDRCARWCGDCDEMGVNLRRG